MTNIRGLPVTLAILLSATLAASHAATTRPQSDQAAIERDWRMQDGIGTEREPRTYTEAIGRTLARGDRLGRRRYRSSAEPVHRRQVCRLGRPPPDVQPGQARRLGGL